MQRRITLFGFFILCLSSLVSAQSASTNSGFAGQEYLLKTGRPPELVAPVLNQPVFLEDGTGIRFSWNAIEMPSDCIAEYVFNIYRITGNEQDELTRLPMPCFSETTVAPFFIYSEHHPSLKTGEKYLLIVNTYLIYESRTEVIDGFKNALVFSYIPECTPPRALKISGIWMDNFNVEWKGVPASPEGVRYKVRYRKIEKNNEWTEILVEKGASVLLDELDNKVQYEVEVQKICPPVDDSPELYSEWANIAGITLVTQSSISLPTFNCGDAFTPPSCGPPYARSGSFDTLYVGGFPIEVDTLWLVNGQNGTWSGSGFIPLPFGQTLVKVEWNVVNITEDGLVCGQVSGISDDSIYFPDLNPGPVAFGGEICIPPPSSPGFDSNGIHNVTGLPWDENGFGPDGSYVKEPPYPGYQSGDPIDTTGTYDPWGFDANGIHWETQTTINPYGCTQEQLNSQPQAPPCDSLPPPYYWLDNTGNPPTQEGNQLANEVKDSIQIWLGQILLEMENAYLDSIDVIDEECDSIRTVMNGLINTLGYDRELIFGPGDGYFEEGMHEKFISEPEPLVTNMDRNSNQEQLEANHIGLYQCDKNLYVIIHLKEIVNDLRTSGLGDFADEIIDKINHFTAEQSSLYANRDSLLLWLENECKENVKSTYTELYGYNSSTEPGLFENLANNTESDKARYQAPTGNYLADGNPHSLALAQSLEVLPEDIYFQFKQGWREINGIHRAYYLEAIAKARNKALFTPPFLTEHDSTLMPIVVGNRASDGKKYEIYLDNIVFTPTSATLDAYILLELPTNGQKIVFEAVDVEFGPTGPQVIPSKLQLVNDVNIRLSNAARLIIEGSENTYVAFDCQGFAGIGIEAEVEICRNYVIPIDTAGNLLPDPKRVHGHFQVFMPTWGEFYLELTMDPFVVNGLEDVKWRIDTVVLDFSETVSPTGTPPEGYACAFAGPNGFHPMWKGFYMKEFSVTLPNQFKSGGGNPITIGVQSVVIDEMGFSGRVFATPLLSLNDGNASGWAFSVDTFSLTIIANSIVNSGFTGLIHVPIISKASGCNTGAPTADDCFGYDAFIEPGNIYHFDIYKPNQSYCIDMWKAGQVTINPNSTISMTLENGEFTAIASLFGKVQINANLGDGINFDLPEITFSGVEVSNKAPYFSPGTWSFPAQIGAQFGGFGLTISGLNMVETDEGDPALKLAANIKITEDSVGLSATGGFKIVGELVTYSGRQRWKFKNVKVDRITLNGSFPGVPKITGFLDFYEEDSTYGSGFRGGVQVIIKNLNVQGFSAVAQFGRVDGYKYFFVDVLACVTIPIGPGIDLKGFGGGVYHHMTRPGTAFSLPACTGAPIPIPVTIGASLSGIIYTPDSSKGLGLKATVVLAVAKENAFNANATFEILFNSGGGLSDIWFYGNARFMAEMEMGALPVKQTGQSPDNGAAVSANLAMHMDFNANTFHGTLETYLSTPGNFIVGNGPGGRMGYAEIHFEPGKWWIKIGRPNDRCGISINIPIIGNIAQVGSYLQIGKNGIDPMPPIPSDILAVVDGQPTSFAPRSGLTGTGTGFIMGAELSIGNKDFQITPFYSTFHFKLGFDVSIIDYGPDAICTTTGNPIGFDGWYAMGQIYAGVWGEIGLKAKVFGKSKQFKILEIAAAATLQAKLPNPFWAQGKVGGEFKVLGGLIKGKCNFKFTIGEECPIEGMDDPLAELKLIIETEPAPNMNEVPVDIKPTAAFTFPMYEQFSLDDSNAKYMVSLDYVKVKYQGYEISSTYKFDAAKQAITVYPAYFLPANDTLTFEVKVHVDSIGYNIYTEERIVTFFTGDALDYIPVTNVKGSYPLDGQFNYYKKEATDGKGYILLHQGQPDLFQPVAGYYPPKIRLKKQNGAGTAQSIMLHATYKPFDNKIEFPIPADCLENGKMYKMELVRIPIPGGSSYGNGAGGPGAAQAAAQAASAGDGPSAPNCGYASGSSGGSSNSNNSNSTTPATPYNAQTPAIGGNTLPSSPPPVPPPAEVKLYTAYFRVSQYNTFKEKIEYWNANKQTTSPLVSKGITNKATIEPFDVYELHGFNGIGPLISFEVDVASMNWYKNTIKPLIYEHFPNQSTPAPTVLDREIQPLGFPPLTQGIAIKQEPAAPEYKILPLYFSAGTLPASFGSSRVEFITFQAPKHFFTDYEDFKKDIQDYIEEYFFSQPYYQNLCANLYPCLCLVQHSTYPAYIYNFYCPSGAFPEPPFGNYQVIAGYKLPGKTYNSSTKQITITK